MKCNNIYKKLPAKLTLTEDARILSTAAAPSPSPSPSPSSGPPSARSTRASKWGRLLGSSSVDSASDTSAKVAVSRSLSARESLRESTAQARQSSTSSSNGGQGNKVIIRFINWIWDLWSENWDLRSMIGDPRSARHQTLRNTQGHTKNFEMRILRIFATKLYLSSIRYDLRPPIACFH